MPETGTRYTAIDGEITFTVRHRVTTWLELTHPRRHAAEMIRHYEDYLRENGFEILSVAFDWPGGEPPVTGIPNPTAHQRARFIANRLAPRPE